VRIARISSTQIGRRDGRKLEKGGVMGAKGDKLMGEGKEAVRTVLGDEALEAEGKHDRQVGDAEAKVDKVESKTAEVFEKAKDEVAKLADKIKDTLHDK